jgi:hypothetical protein
MLLQVRRGRVHPNQQPHPPPPPPQQQQPHEPRPLGLFIEYMDLSEIQNPRAAVVVCARQPQLEVCVCVGVGVCMCGVLRL